MLRILISALLLTSCSLGTKTKGGKKDFYYQAGEDYKLEKLSELAPRIIETSQRNPPVGTLDELFSKERPDILRVGIIVFETQIQDTRSGLASDEGKIYPTASGKQIMTEKFLSIWEEALPIVDPELNYVSSAEVKASKSLHRAGAEVEDHPKSSRTELSVDDIVYLEKGKATAMATILNPRGMRDFSFVLVPATELMNGPKWSEHQKHMLNEVVKELKLDAALVIMTEASWQAAHKEKLTGDHKPSELKVKITASTLIPFSKYHERLEASDRSNAPQVNVAYRTYKGMLTAPVSLDAADEEKTYATIQEKLIGPLFATYRDLALMTMLQMKADWEKTR